MKIRLATIDDLDAIIALGSHPEITQWDFEVTAEHIARMKSELDRSADLSVEHYLVEVDGESCASYIVFRHWGTDNKDTLGRDCIIYYLGFCTHPNYQNRGILKAALSDLIKEKFSHGLVYIYAECDRRNKACRAVLTRLGFYEQKVPMLHRLAWWWHMKRSPTFCRFLACSETDFK